MPLNVRIATNLYSPSHAKHSFTSYDNYLVFISFFFLFFSLTGPEKSSKIDCDFENSQLCGYKQESRSDFDWNRTSGENKLKKQQPDADHTYRTSHGKPLIDSLPTHYYFLY